MQTRSQAKPTELEVNIDFDEASRCWNHNKKRLASGTYVYVCGADLKPGGYCQRRPEKNNDHCYLHKSKVEKTT